MTWAIHAAAPLLMVAVFFAATALPIRAGAASPTEAHRVVDEAEQRADADPSGRVGNLQVCGSTGGLSSRALTIETAVDGSLRVTRSQLIDRIDGDASGGTTGGLGGRLYVVDTDRDYLPGGEPPIPGSLRDAILRARKSRSPAWIAVRGSLRGHEIALKAPLRVPSDVTLDATCAGVSLVAAPEVMLVGIVGVRNVVIAGFRMHKTPYSGENKGRADGKDFRDCITVSGQVDALAILNNEFGACGDGQIDITSGVGREMPKAGGRITVAFNRFLRHDKAMLVGTDGCVDHAGSLTAGCSLESGAAAPGYRVTFEGNAFLWTGQRNPRAFGLVDITLVNNVFVFEPYDRGNGTRGASYGQYVSNGARVRARSNVYVGAINRGAERPLGLFMPSTPGASAVGGDIDGTIEASGNLRFADEIIAGDDAATAGPSAGGALDTHRPDMRRLGVAGAIACIVAHAGPDAGVDWPERLCGKHR